MCVWPMEDQVIAIMRTFDKITGIFEMSRIFRFEYHDGQYEDSPD